MTLNQLKRAARAKIEESGYADGDGTVVTEMLFEHAFGFSRNFIISEPNYNIDENSREYTIFSEALTLYLSGTPIQHILGYADFCAMRYFVNENVLIPRQETEILVKLALGELKKREKGFKVLDLCTGSGAIGIAVKKYFPRAEVTMSDISPLALKVARMNAETLINASEVTFEEGSYLDPIIKSGEKFDLLLSNPPYISTEDMKILPENVMNHDPDLALHGGKDGLFAYREIISKIENVLNDGAFVCFEIGETQGLYVVDLLKAKGFFPVEIIKDLDGKDRFVCGRFNKKACNKSLTLDSPVSKLNGVGTKSALAYNSMNIEKVSDLISFYPVRYEARNNISTVLRASSELSVCTLKLKIKNVNVYGNPRKPIISAVGYDNTGEIKLVFFNQIYVKSLLYENATYYFYGKVNETDFRLNEIVNPAFVDADSPKAADFLRIRPIYRSRGKVLRNDVIHNNVLTALTLFKQTNGCYYDLPREILSKYNLIKYSEAIEKIHLPYNEEDVHLATKRLGFDELLNLTLKISFLKKSRELKSDSGVEINSVDITPLLEKLPYKLTAGQTEVLAKITEDLLSGKPMNRLVIGDVGSGKTAIATASAYMALESGHKASLMVPSTVLAEQHYHKIKPLLESLGYETLLLYSGLKASEKKKVTEKLKTQGPLMVIGTHSLIQDNVIFNDLGLIITDEQHRFGVNQRGKIAKSTEICPHMLSLSATPIPRTLALILYGDMDISFLKEKPGGRIPIETKLFTNRKRNFAYDFAKEQVKNGRQVFIVHPCIEDPEAELDCDEAEISALKKMKACVSNYEELSKTVFSGLRTGILHGKMKDIQKDEVMKTFAEGNIDILFSTTVIEVGIDVPNATLMIIENAERFGLSQLHQLRGRVGRGSEKSYCYLISDSANDNKRLETIVSSSDGFEISEKDLEIRGPGELFGTMQSGLPLFKLANPMTQPDILQNAVACAGEMTELCLKGDREAISFCETLLKENDSVIL